VRQFRLNLFRIKTLRLKLWGCPRVCHPERMKQCRILIAALTILLSATAFAQDTGIWRAESQNAKNITGDLGIGTLKISLNFKMFTIAQIRKLKPEEISSVFDADLNAGGFGNLYRLDIPGDFKLLHKNTLCGGQPTEYMVTYATGKELHIAFFSGSAIPQLTPEAMNGSTDLCGIFTYVR
jgi:hypothetical protein